MHPSLVSASLYVGDLHPDVTESELLEPFSVAGPVASIRVLRDAMTRRSLGYAYVNYHNIVDAERALDTLNYNEIRGKPIRIMWKHRDPSKRRSGVGNIFVKNLDKSIDSRALNDTFSQFGNILSCKVVTDEGGNSKGYGFVQYETKEEADTAIEKVNGNIIADKRVYVGPFVPAMQRQHEGGMPKFTNVFIKNLPEDVTKEKLEAEFAKYGKVTSAVVVTDAEGKSKCFGFVNFEEFEAAAKAAETLNNTTPFGGEKPIYVGKAEKRAQRQAELRRQWAQRKAELMQKYSGTNLYVKNLDDAIEDDQLRANFATFGTITSAKVEKEEGGKSKGFGYVCFSSADDATRAVTDMNGKMVGQKPIYVALHQPKEVRRAYLQSQSIQRQFQQSQNMPRYPAQQMGPLMYAGGPQPRGQFLMFPHPGMGPGGRGFVPRPGMGPMGAPQQRRNFGGGSRRPPGPGGVPAPGGRGAAGQQQVKFAPNVRNRDQQAAAMGAQGAAGGASAMPQQMPVVPGALSKEQLASILVNSSPEQQKQLLGERLYALIVPSQGTLTGKITGMLLEGLDNSELLHLIDSPEALQSKIHEAISALRAHMDQQGTPEGEQQ